LKIFLAGRMHENWSSWLSWRGVMLREYYVVIERDEDGFYVGEVPALKACYAQGKTLDKLMTNIKEVIELCLEGQPEGPEVTLDFIGVQKVTIDDNLAHA